MKNSLVPLLLLITSALLQAKDYRITDFGAEKGKPATQYIQNAVNQCFQDGGGRVVIPSGTFISGTVELKSNVELHLEPGAVLEASLNLDDYTRTFRNHGMVFCRDAENVSITGTGTIHARGIEFYDSTANHVYDEFDKSLVRQKENYMPEGTFFTDGPIKRKPKPGMAVCFYNCSRVKLIGFLLKDTPSWGIRLAYCDDVMIQGISIYNNLLIPNSDGVHCTASRNIRMSDCDIRAGDDAFIVTGFAMEEEIPGIDHVDLSSFRFGNKSNYAENVTVSNCVFQTRSSGIRIGYGQHPIRRCTFSNIVIYGSNRGIGIFAHDASDIEDLVFSNILIETRLHNGQWWGNGEPVHLSAASRFEGEPAGQIRNVIFEHIVACSEHGILIYGQEEALMENIRFSDFSLKIVKGRETEAYGGNFDLRPAADIRLQLFEHDIPGLYAQYVNGLEIESFKLEWGQALPSFFTHGIECRHVNGLHLNDIQAEPNPASAGSKSLYLKNTAIRK